MSRKEEMERYWEHVHEVAEREHVPTHTARDFVHNSLDYASKRAERDNKDVMSWEEFWKNAADMTQAERDAYFESLEEDYEFGSGNYDL